MDAAVEVTGPAKPMVASGAVRTVSLTRQVTVGQAAFASLPVLGTIAFAVLLPALSIEAGLSFVVLGMVTTLHGLYGIRGRSSTAIDASIFVFGLLFMLVAPIVQLSVMGLYLVNTTHATQELIVKTNLACAAFTLSYLAGRVLLFKDSAPIPARLSRDQETPVLNPFALVLLVALCAFITLISIPFAGASASDPSAGPLLLAFRKFLFFIPTALFLIVFIRVKSLPTQGRFLHVALLVVLFVCVVATQNPGTEKRNALGPIYLSILFLVFRDRLGAKWVQVAVLTLVLLVLFPVSSLFTHIRWEYLRADDFRWEVLTDHFLSTHYDAWANIYTAIEMIERRGIMAGQQLAGAVLFFVPSSTWSHKPLASGIEIAHFLMASYQMWFTNLSAPLAAEGLLDFGALGVVGYGLALAWLARKVERWASHAGDGFMLAIAVYLSFFIVFLLRGSLMIAVAYGSGALAAFIAARLLVALVTLRRRTANPPPVV